MRQDRSTALRLTRRLADMTSPYRHLSIRTQMFLLVLVSMLPAVGILAWQLTAASTQARDAAYAKVKVLADDTAAVLAQVLRENETVLGRLAERPLVRALDAKNCDPIVREYVLLHPEYTTLGVRDLQGNIICSYVPNPVAQLNPRDFPWFEEGLRSGKFTVGDAFLGRQTNRWVSVLTYPIRDEAGKASGLLALPVDLVRLNQRLLGSVPSSAIVAAIDRQGKILLRSVEIESWAGKPIPAQAVEALRDLREGFSPATGVDGVPRLYAIVTVPLAGWKLVAGVPESEVFAAYRAALARGILIGVSTLALALAIAWWLGSVMAKPIDDLARASARVAAGDTSARARLAGPAEIKAVARQFNLMLDARARAEESIRANEEHLRTIIDTEPECVKLLDKHGRLLDMNAAGLAMIEAGDLAQVAGRPLGTLILPEHLDAFHELTKNVLKGNKGTLVFEIEGLKGTRRWLETHAAPMTTREGETVLLGVTRDITERRHAEERLSYLAHHDELTGLPNRTLFYDRLQQAMIDADRHGRLVAVVFVDLDRFKNVNDTLGHEAGDQLLKGTAERLTGAVRRGDTVARLSGDEFTIVLADMGHVEDAARVAQKILDVFAQAFRIAGRDLFIGASLGITVFPSDTRDAGELLRNADIAMYRAKEAGRNICQFYAAEMTAKATEAMVLESDLRRGLERGEFLLHYQPIVDGRGTILGAEALLRWQHDERGLVPPAQFIALAEETGLIMPIGDWVLREACAQAHAWRGLNGASFRIAVNVSARQFRHGGLAQTVEKILKETGLDPHALDIEITESVLMQQESFTQELFSQLNGRGVSFSIDDFGTGYSSLSYLKRFPIDYLKIDRSFIRDVTTDADDAALVKAIIGMAHDLGIQTVAEGVETREQRAFLLLHGCDAMQGFYFSRPVLPEAFAALLAAGKLMSANLLEES